MSDENESSERGLGDTSLSCLLEATQALSGAEDLESGLGVVARCLNAYVPYDTLGVLLLDDLGKELRFAVAVGFPLDVAESWRFGLGQGIVGTVAQTGEPILVRDAGDDSRYIRAAPGVRSELALPLIVKERTIGVLDLGSGSAGSFEETHLRLLEPLATQLAIAIESARLYQNLKEQTHVLSLLHEVSRELTSILDREELLERVAELARRVIDYDVFTLFLWNQDSRLLEPATSVHRDGLTLASARPLKKGEGICGVAAALRQPMRIANVHLDPRYVSCVDGLEVRSEMAVPLTFEDRLVGVLDLESAEFDAFTARHEEALSTLAGSMAIALENSRLYQRLRENEKQLEQDLTAARGIQKQLLPTVTPWVQGLNIAVAAEPARHLGGDFYDFFAYGEGRTAVAVGDVSGKATPAALYGSMAVGTLRELADAQQPGPAGMLADMNTRLHQLDIGNRFLAMVFAVYCQSSRTLKLASSGLPRPLLARSGNVTALDVSGVPLGLLPGRTYEELEVEMRPGDVVVVHSDGIDEAPNRDGEELGSERVAQIVAELAGGSVREIADGLLDAVCRFSREGDPSDDRTILVLKAVDQQG